MKIKHEISYGENIITGLVDNNEVIILYTHVDRPDTVGSSACLPVSIDKAKEYLECYNAAFKKYDEIKEQQKNG